MEQMSLGEIEESKPQSITYVYQELPCVERINYYRPGGFHPVHLDDTFQNGRYTVVHKLGYGAYATVWLVKDSLLNKYASLKIIAADHSKSSSEVAVLRHLRNRGGTHEHVITSLDDFEHEGPNGIHQCIISEVLGPHLANDEIEDLYPTSRLPPSVGKRLAVQIASGVAHLHKHGVVHGDLHLANLLLHSPSISAWSSQSDVEEFLGKPEPATLRLQHSTESPPETAHAPRYVLGNPDPEKLLQLCLGLEPWSDCYPSKVHIKLCDFGESFISNSHPQVRISNCPRVYAAPEIMFDGLMSPKSDIWALAVLIHTVVSGGATVGIELFPSRLGITKEVMRGMVFTLGKFPQKWWDKWTERDEYFDEDGNWIGDDKKLSRVSRMFLKIPASYLDQEEKECFERLLRDMAKYEPEQRPDACEVLERISNLWKTS